MIQEHKKDEFIPKGAIAFLTLMVLVMAVIWFATYAIMLLRH